jgi:hypothetical protein
VTSYTDEDVAALHVALADLLDALREIGWPFKRRMPHMIGYSRERGRRSIIKESCDD